MIGTMEEGERVVGLWFVYGKEKRDWLACAVEMACGGRYRVVYRFRYHNSPDPFDESDEKNWYSFTTITDDDGAVIEPLSMLARTLIKQGFNDTLDYVPVDGDNDRMFELIRDRPWCHIKVERTAQDGVA